MATNKINVAALNHVNMEKGQLYETIITTSNLKGEYNAAPIGVVCKNPQEIILYLYEGTLTLNNIKKTCRFGVNLTEDPLLFTEATFGNISPDSFDDYNDFPVLKDADAFFIAKTTEIKEVLRKDHLGESHLFIVTAIVEDIVKNAECVHPINRGIYAVIESLVHYTRIEMADDEKRKIYWRRIKEMDRVARKVGSKEEKIAMKQILEAIKEKVGNLDL